MMHFSERLMDVEVELEEGDTASRGRIVTLFEGRNWTPMTVVRFFSGPQQGRAFPIPLEVLTFPEPKDGS